MTRIQQLLLAAGVVLAAVIAFAMLRSAQATPVKAPPPVDRTVAHVVFGSDVVRSGAALTFTVHNPTRAPFAYGVGGGVDRWNGTGWERAYYLGPGTDEHGAARQLVPAGQNFFVSAVGLIAPAQGVGSAEEVWLEGMPEGWYRLSVTSVIAGSETPITPAPTPAHDGPVAYGIFRVTPRGWW